MSRAKWRKKGSEGVERGSSSSLSSDDLGARGDGDRAVHLPSEACNDRRWLLDTLQTIKSSCL